MKSGTASRWIVSWIQKRKEGLLIINNYRIFIETEKILIHDAANVYKTFHMR